MVVHDRKQEHWAKKVGCCCYYCRGVNWPLKDNPNTTPKLSTITPGVRVNTRFITPTGVQSHLVEFYIPCILLINQMNIIHQDTKHKNGEKMFDAWAPEGTFKMTININA